MPPYYNLTTAPTSFAPYLDDSTRRLTRQYLVTLLARPGEDAGPAIAGRVVGGEPLGIAANPATRIIYVGLSLARTVAVVGP